MTIDFTYLQSSADNVIALKNEFNVALTAYIEGIKAIDPKSPDAQSQLDTVKSEFTNYQQSIIPDIKDKINIYTEYALANTNLVKEVGNAEDQKNLDAIIKQYDASKTNIDLYVAERDKKQSEITQSQSKPGTSPTVPEPVASGISPNIQAAPGTSIAPGQIVPPAPLLPTTKITPSVTATPNHLNAFISNIKKFGVPLSSKFEVELPSIGEITDLRPINILCNSASMPEQRIRLTEMKIFGENNFLAGGVDFGQLQLTFLVTTQFAAHDYFDVWLDMIYSKNRKTLGFYNQYTKEIAVHNLDRSGQRIFSTYYQECFPISVQTTGVSYDNNHPMTLNVTFAYRTWSTFTTSNSLLDPELNPLKLNAPSALRAFDNSTLGDPTTPFGGNGVAAATALGPIMGSSALDAANQAAQGVKTLSNLSDGTPVGSLMSKYMNQLGTSSSVIGAGIGSIGSNLNTILAPAQAIAGGVTSMSGVLSSVDNLLGRMGIRTNIGNVVGNLNGVAGVISVVGQLNGIPGALSSLGSVMGSVGGEIENIQRSLANVPGATKQMTNTMSNLGKVTSDNANTTSNIAGMNFTNPPTGLNNNINPNNSQVSYTG